MNLSVNQVAFKANVEFLKDSRRCNEIKKMDIVDFEYKPLAKRGINEFFPGIVLAKNDDEAEVVMLKGRDKGEVITLNLNNSDYSPQNIIGRLNVKA